MLVPFRYPVPFRYEQVATADVDQTESLLEMALPKWVLSERVDSTAMLHALQAWSSANPDMAKELGLEKGLPTINHCPSLDSPDMKKVMEIPCPRGDSSVFLSSSR